LVWEWLRPERRNLVATPEGLRNLRTQGAVFCRGDACIALGQGSLLRRSRLFGYEGWKPRPYIFKPQLQCNVDVKVADSGRVSATWSRPAVCPQVVRARSSSPEVRAGERAKGYKVKGEKVARNFFNSLQLCNLQLCNSSLLVLLCSWNSQGQIECNHLLRSTGLLRFA